MSVIAVGPALAIDGPLPEPPPFSLVQTPGVLVNDPGDRWINGVYVYAYPTDVPSTWEPCSTGTFRTKPEGTEVPRPRFDSFGIVLAITCSAGYAGDWETFSRRAEIALEASQSFAVEEALSQGVALSINPFLGDSNVDVLAGGAAQTPTVGLAYLEEAIGLTGRRGMIHATPPVVSTWEAFLDRDILMTTNGNRVVSGGGYIGAEANGAPAAAGQSWVFATGPVEVRLSPMTLIGDDINGTLDTTTNELTFRAEKYALATWDTALQAAVLIDWTP